ncbi:hypothetical protein RGCCGE502_19695 [Rhizobium grahamii CCGE 502]|uniref:SyrB-like regulator n=2 Tax=Rhizobium grahamii TaxID=1120045 RepID=S3IBM3_9HYPH|nr:hypothetical protein RGCCGE502_19695 [Rhizobium grahamii CCGE 502]
MLTATAQSKHVSHIKEFHMADELNATVISGTAPGNAPKEKKTRAPRKPKTAAETAVSASVSEPAKKTRGRRKNAEKADAVVSVIPVAAKKAAPVKAVEKKQPAKRGPRKAEAAPAASDEFADLLKLEEENQKLRKALSEKLRAENADLRKKLGA